MTLRRMAVMGLILSLMVGFGMTVFAQVPQVKVPIDGMKVIRVGSAIDRVVVGSSGQVRAKVVTGQQIMLFGINSGSTTLHVWTEAGLRKYELEIANMASDGVGESGNLLQEVGEVNAQGNEMRVYTPEYREVTQFEQYISRLLGDKGEIVLSDSSSGKIFVLGPSSLLDKIGNLIDEIDVPGQDETYTRRIVLENRSAGDLSEKIQEMLTEKGKVVVDEETNSLLIVDNVSKVKQITNYLDNVDVPTTKQVRIEAKFVEVNDQVTRELGVDWTFSGSMDGHDMDLGLLPKLEPASGLSGNIAGNSLSPGDDLTASLQALESENLLNLISSPNVMTRNNEQARLEILNEQAYIAGCDLVTTESGSQAEPVIESTEDGITLEVTPMIGSNNVIHLDVIPTLKIVSFNEELSDESDCGEIRFPQTDRRRAELNVALKDGQTLVIGGLSRNQKDEGTTSVPFFSEIPALGRLFQQNTNETNDKEITIFLTASIVPMSPENSQDTAATTSVDTGTTAVEESRPSTSSETSSSDVLLD